MAQYLLRDGSKVTFVSDFSEFDVFTYLTSSGQPVHALLTIHAERAMLRSVNLDQMVELHSVPPVRIQTAVG